MPPPSPPSTGPTARPLPPELGLLHLWRQGEAPDVWQFLAGAGPLPPDDLVAVLAVDQQERWQRGERVWAEAYLEKCPALAGQPESALELIYGEFLLREQLGESPPPEEYLRRFPAFAARLEEQFRWHSALGTLPPAPADHRASTASGAGGWDVPAAGRWPRVPDHEVVGVLGRGAMGVVYKARQVSLKRTVALKMVLPGRGAGEEELARFHTEAEAVARLQHPNVVQIFTVGLAEDGPYFTMELVEGGTLAARAAGTPWPPRTAAELVQTIARAMHHAHGRGILHRDLKPGNVLLTADGTPKITDFGLAKLFADPGAGQTRSDALLGTPSYMAPEQAEARPDVGPAADTYALGAILYELLTGRPPFKGDTPLETLRQVTQTEPVPVLRLQPKVPRDLETICLKCLQKQPGKRYASAEALADDLGRLLAGVPIRGRPAGVGERAVKWARRQPALAALVALAALTLLGLAGAGWWYAARESRHALEQSALRGEADDNAQLYRKERDAARLNLYISHINLAQREWETGHVGRTVELLEAALPGEGEEDRRGFEWYYLWSLCHGELLALSHPGGTTALAFSPDGRLLASAGLHQTVRVWDAATGREAHALEGHTRRVQALAFSRDGRRLASASWVGGTGRPGEVKVWDMTDGRAVVTLPLACKQVPALSFSPDGRRLATAGEDRGRPLQVCLWDATTGRLIRTTPVAADGPGGARPAAPHVNDVAPRGGVAFSPDGRLLASAGGRTVRVCDPATGRQLLSLTTGCSARQLTFSPDNRRLAVCDKDRTLEVWALPDDRRAGAVTPPLRLKLLTAQTEEALPLAFSPDGTRLAVAEADGVVRVRDTATGKVCRALKGHKPGPLSVAYSPDGRRLATGSYDGTVKVWDALRGPKGDLAFLELALPPGDMGFYGVAFSPDGRRLATASGVARVWSAATGQPLLDLRDPLPAAVGPPAAPPPTPRQLAQRGQLVGLSHCVAFSPDGRFVAAPSGRDVVVWDAATGRPALRIKARSTVSVWGLAYSPDGRRLASVVDERTVQVWDVSAGPGEVTAPLLTLRGPHAWNVRLAFGPDGRRLTCTGGLWGLRTWDVSAGRGAAAGPLFTDEGGPVLNGLAYSRDGRRLAVASQRGAVDVWDVSAAGGARPALALALRGHTNQVSAVAFSPDGRRLASAGDDGAVKIWEAATGQELLSLPGHTSWVYAVAFSPDGRRLASASQDGTVKVWEAPRPAAGARR
ncbi:MAG TPA: serine/threonine-protein kinase [Gemmataceae bacterium]|nr:serine/threonine-protein kinase [Gemmataceae bacterium]